MFFLIFYQNYWTLVMFHVKQWNYSRLYLFCGINASFFTNVSRETLAFIVRIRYIEHLSVVLSILLPFAAFYACFASFPHRFHMENFCFTVENSIIVWKTCSPTIKYTNPQVYAVFCSVFPSFCAKNPLNVSFSVGFIVLLG